MGAFFHAVHVFFDDIADVRWEFLAIGLGLHLLRLALRAVAWRTILQAAYPKERVRLLSAFGAYVAGVGVNSVVPARAGDAVKLVLIKRRIPGSSYATLTPTLIVETLFDFVVATGLIIWALAIGVLPTRQVYQRLPSVDWRIFVKYERETLIGLGILLAAAVIGLILLIEHGEEFRARVARGFAILHYPRRFTAGVIFPQAISWLLRVGSLYYFLQAFGVQASIHNALLALVVDSLATLFPATPGGAGTKQGLIVFLFRNQAISSSLLLAFSVGVNIATVVFNLVLGLAAIALMTGSFSWKRLREERARELDTPEPEAAPPGP
jgi:uncharacterized membrane protein YbhN (UPF0104 family)